MFTKHQSHAHPRSHTLQSSASFGVSRSLRSPVSCTLQRQVYSKHSLNLEFPIFIILLIPTGLIAYFTYYKDFKASETSQHAKTHLSTLLNHAYFFDDLYYAVVKGINRASEGLTRIENTLFGVYPDSAGAKIRHAADPGQASTLKKGPSSTV